MCLFFGSNIAGVIDPRKLRKLCVAFHCSGVVIIFEGRSSNEANVIGKTSVISPVG